VTYLRVVAWWEHFLLRVSIAFDNLVQAFMERAVIGVTISSRSGTAEAHGHRWGCVMCKTILAWWPFGPDENGRPHCKLAIESDIARAKAVLVALQDDPVVQAYLNEEDK